MLYGKELEFIERADAVIENGMFTRIGNADAERYDAEGLLMVPGLINAHTHIADSIAKDVASMKGFNERVNPAYGVKRSVLNSSKPEHISAYMRMSALSMLKKGITTFADFREGGREGIMLLKNALKGLEIRCLALGRAEYYFNAESAQNNDDLPEDVKAAAKDVLQISDGFGISGANEYSNRALEFFSKTARSGNKLLGIHAAEAEESIAYSAKNFGASEVNRIMRNMSPDFLVHMTNASDEDMKLVSDNTGIVICPRANSALGVGFPKIGRMLKQRYTIAIGTDNVMVNSPDLFRELDYTWKACKAVEKEFIDARELLKMVTVNAAKILKLKKLGYIAENMLADAVFIDKHSIDLEPMHDPYASIVHRLNESSIRAVMVGGRFVHGSL
jgi:cytosine/adenosine deaminase-related metal-dependent hydrolase